jgi:hypothetical protein
MIVQHSTSADVKATEIKGNITEELNGNPELIRDWLVTNCREILKAPVFGAPIAVARSGVK